MELLPSELYIGIFQFVSKSDLKSIRLVSKRLNTISSPFLFNKVYASFHFQDLKVLEAISNHPTLRLLVKEVVYSAVYFYLSEIKNHGRGKLSKSDFLLGRRHYLDCLVKCDKMWLERDDQNIIFAAIARMPNIQMLTFTNHWRPTRDLLGECPWPERFGRLLEDPEGARFGGPMSRTYPAYAKEPCGRPPRFTIKTFNLRADEGFWIINKAISMANIKAQMLCVDYLTGGFSPGTFCLSPSALKYACDTFRHLRKVALSLSGEKTDVERIILMEGTMAVLLATAEGLEELTIDFEYMLHGVPLRKFLGTHTWPRLRSIRLFRKEMHQAELTELLARHCKTLRVLHLDSVYLESGNWIDVARELHGLLALESISLHKLGHRMDELWADTRNLKDYLTHGTSGPIYQQDCNTDPLQ